MALLARTLRTLTLHPAVWSTCVRGLQVSPVVCAGHNKWSKVKHIKGPKDEARAKVFNRLAKLLQHAVREGGPNPELNLNLAQLLQRAKDNNVPKATVDVILKNAEKAKPASKHIFEVRGHGGCLLLIQVLTENMNYTNQDIKQVLKSKGGAISEGARHNFDKKGVVVVQRENVSMDRALELAIEVGAEDVQETTEDEEPVLEFICDEADLPKVGTSLASHGLKVNFAGLNFIPRVLLPLDQEQLEAAAALVEALHNLDVVVQIWDNIQGDL